MYSIYSATDIDQDFVYLIYEEGENDFLCIYTHLSYEELIGRKYEVYNNDITNHSIFRDIKKVYSTKEVKNIEPNLRMLLLLL